MTDSAKQTIAQSEDRSRNKPVKIFLSDASEDEDIMIAVSQTFDRLQQLSNGNIRTIYDKKSLKSALRYLSFVRLQINCSDQIIVILYTGSLKRSFSWTGTELGIFRGFIKTDERDHGSSQRKIIAMYSTRNRRSIRAHWVSISRDRRSTCDAIAMNSGKLSPKPLARLTDTAPSSIHCRKSGGRGCKIA